MPTKKIRVHELSKRLGLSNEETIQLLQKEGIEVKSHSSTVDAETAELIAEVHEEGANTEKDETPEEDETEIKTALDDSPLLVKEDEIDEDEALVLKAARVKHADLRAEKTKKVKKPKKQEETVETEEQADADANEIYMRPPIVVKELADAMDVKANVLIVELMGRGIMANINQAIEVDIAQEIVAKHGKTLIAEKRTKGAGALTGKDSDEIVPEEIVYEDAAIEPRPAVVAFLGHVDHGKTSLQDKLRNTDVCAGEAGAITQHVGASTIEHDGHKVTFIDTPGHEAFTAMRARGADVTDIIVLVVAADDGFMPQTIEALKHAKAAGVVIIVAINKMDLESADKEKVLRQMMEQEIMPEDWGGEYAAIPVSAATGEGLNDLLDRIMLESEMLEIKANSKLPGQAVILEAELEQGLGATANILIQNGTIKQGDIVLCNRYFGKVKAMIDSNGKRLKTAGPSTPVKLVGLNGVPACGDKLVVCENERTAKRLSAERGLNMRQESLQPNKAASLDELLAQFNDEKRTNLKVIVKTDVQGTCEAVCDSLMKLDSPKVKLDIMTKAVGAITENDVLLAAASGALIVGFHVRVNPGVNQIARREGVEIHLYSIIYELIDKIRAAMEGRLEPEYKEIPLGKAEILQIITLTKRGKVCGSAVKEGLVRVGAKARVYRDGDLIYNGDVASLRRFQDDVKEVRIGLECGIKLDNFKDFEVGDVIDIYELEELKPSL